MSDEPTGKGPPEARRRAEALERLWSRAQQLIEGSHLFRFLDDAGRQELLHRGRLVFFPASTVILKEGETGDSFFVIDEGVVEVSAQADAAGEVALTTLQRGAFFGEVAMLTGAARTATITALTDVSAVAFDRKDIDELLGSNPKPTRLLEAVIAGRARDAAEDRARQRATTGHGSGRKVARGRASPRRRHRDARVFPT